MQGNRSRGVLAAALALLGATAAGCTTGKDTRPYLEPPPPGITSTFIDYVETDAFDTLLESALTTQDPVIVIRTGRSQPDWGGRLNAWVAAWNLGGKVEPGPTRARMQAPVPPVVVNGETIREFRLLVNDLMGRVEELARQGSAWWAEERVKVRRVALLRPYNLRFHLAEDGTIQLILFNGRYAPYYGDYMRALARPDAQEPEVWSRVVSCSRCKHSRREGDETSRPVSWSRQLEKGDKEPQHGKIGYRPSP